VKKFLILILFAAMLVVMLGCTDIEIITDNDSTGESEEILLYSNITTLDEGYYLYVGPFSYIDNFTIELMFTKIPSYGLEVWIMTDSQLYDFENYGLVTVVTHFTVYGDNILKISSLNWFEDYYIVFDNTDKGGLQQTLME